MHWKDTVLKQREIRWSHPEFKYVDDNKIDIILTIPITRLLEEQARRSFTNGVFEMLKHVANTPIDDSVDVSQVLKDKFIEWGLPQNAIDSIQTAST